MGIDDRPAPPGDPHAPSAAVSRRHRRFGSEDAITPGLVRTRRAYAAAYAGSFPKASRFFLDWLAAGRALPSQRLPLVRQFAHALASSALLTAQEPGSKGASMTEPVASPPSLDEAGAALKALGEDVVLLAFYRAGDVFPEDRYSVRLALDGAESGIQESAATPSAALAKAFASRSRQRTNLAAEAALRRELASRGAAAP